jgi:hypothetical protein
MFIPNLIFEFVLKPIWLALYWFAGWMCMVFNFVPKWIWLNLIIPMLKFFAWLEIWIWINIVWPIFYWLFIWLPMTIIFYIKLVIRLILIPLDQLCYIIFAALEGIIDAIVAIIEAPEWQPMFGNWYALPITLATLEIE